MKRPILFMLFLFGLCFAGEPCERLAEIVGDYIQFLREDYYVGQATNWRMNEYIDEAKEHVLSTIGMDITSATDREEIACRALRIKRLKDVYDFLKNETPIGQRLTYDAVCNGYKMFVRMDKQVETQLDVEFLKELYSIAKDFANWMDKSGFPERFPPSINHTGQLSGRDLQKIITLVRAFSSRMPSLRGMLSELLPLGPLIESEIEYGGANRSTPEEIVGWMEDSNNIFAYAGKIKENVNEWLSVRDLQGNYDMLRIVKYNYDKLLWYEEAVRIVLKSRIFSLDTSDCPKEED